MTKRFTFGLFLWLINACFSAVYAQDDIAYQTPPASIADIIDAPANTQVSIDTRGQYVLLMQPAQMPTIEELSQPELRLAGLRINPQTNGPSRGFTIIGLKLKNLSTGQETNIEGLPAKLAASGIRWSPNDSRIAFVQTETDHLDLYVIEVASAKAQKVNQSALNGVLGTAYDWVADSQTLLALTIPDGRGSMPVPNRVPNGPVVQENLGKKAPARTFQDLLKNPSDEAIFEYLGTSQLCKIDLKNKKEYKLGAPAMYNYISPSPDAQYILVKSLHRPFSYLVTADRFPLRVDVLDFDGKVVHQQVDLPLFDNIPSGFDAVAAGQRGHLWRADAAATLVWVEAQDEGNPKKEVAFRDKVWMLKAPFKAQPELLAQTTYRFRNIRWGNDNLAMLSEGWTATRKAKASFINPAQPSEEAKLIYDRLSEDSYTDPGNPVTVKNERGRFVLAIENNKIFWIGEGASPDGDRPFVDAYDLATGATNRLWRSEAPYFENPVAMIDFANPTVLLSRESLTENPNYWVVKLDGSQASQQITNFAHPYPQLKEVQKITMKYQRYDGVDLKADLYLPAGYDLSQGGLPALLWAYPQEFKNKQAASQVQGSPYRFAQIRWGSPLFWVTRGYAIIDGAAMPIVGEGTEEPNDTFVEQLVGNAQAAVDEAARLGYVDKQRVAAGGHSYGAFMTANLLAHSDIFCAGIARSGAYNRTLTPFGFQAEERTFWEAPEVYGKMSPFNYAHQIKEPILLIHGEADNNSGTFPLQSERFYNALKGHGATTRFVLLPYESHGYAARESVLHMLWEMDQWLEKYVKNRNAN